MPRRFTVIKRKATPGGVAEDEGFDEIKVTRMGDLHYYNPMHSPRDEGFDYIMVATSF